MNTNTMFHCKTKFDVQCASIILCVKFRPVVVVVVGVG